MSPNTLSGGPAPQRPILRSPEVKAFLYSTPVMGETLRARKINRYHSHYLCEQYAHLPHDWWGITADQAETVSPSIMVPFGFEQPALGLTVRQKRPTAPYNLTKAIVERFTGLLFGNIRKPVVSVENDPDTEAMLNAIIEQSQFWRAMRLARNMGGACGSVLVTTHIAEGQFQVQVHNPAHVAIVWKDRRSMTVAGALIMYRYKVEEDVLDEKTGQPTGETKLVDFLYRRIITEDEDIIYVPVKVEPGVQVEWTEQYKVEHKLGMFPGVWIQNRPVTTESIDGDADCHGAWQHLDTIDRLIAQVNKGTLLNLDPTLAMSYDPKQVQAAGGVRKGSENALALGPGGSAQYLELAGTSTQTGLALIDALEKHILNVVRCVMVDPDKISGAAQSAKAIEYLFAPMLEAADELREQYGAGGIVPLLRIMERMARIVYARKQRLLLPPRVISRPGKDDVAEHKLGPGGWIKIKWGPYFALTEQDKQLRVTTAANAKGAALVDQETAVREAAEVFGVRDVEGMVERIAQEQEKALQDAIASAGLGDGGVPMMPEEPDVPPGG